MESRQMNTTLIKTVNDVFFLNELDTGYFERAEVHHGDYLQMYADSLSWAASTISGCSFFDVTPKNFNEVVLALFSLLIGTISLAKIFADLEQLRELSEIEHHELK
jgi:hypothetical protein